MTPEQLEKANQLNKKIALSKKHLEFMKQSAAASDANKVPVTNFSINYNGGVGNIKAISFAPDWIQNETIRLDTQDILRNLRDELIKQFEHDNFGTVNTDFSEAEKVCNMYVYILGEEIINNLETVKNNWDDDFTPELLEELKTELEAI